MISHSLTASHACLMERETDMYIPASSLFLLSSAQEPIDTILYYDVRMLPKFKIRTYVRPCVRSYYQAKREWETLFLRGG